ncbi:MAG: biotin transporter BioY [Deltaproteobacteria bacterium]|jgi:biotin transport system substrate-specific component|nr:biotin transporter BioY [Deltaproteobacteria bacterium]
MSQNPEISMSQMLGVVRLAIWGAMMALGAWISFPVGPVPITMQTYFLFVAGFVEGPRAAWAAGLYLLAGLLGLPVFTGAVAGPALMLGPTVGYALSFPLIAAICGLGRRKPVQSPARLFLFGLIAIAVLYLCGSIGLTFTRGLSLTSAIGVNLVFIPGDLIKLSAAVAVVMGLAYKRKRFAQV